MFLFNLWQGSWKIQGKWLAVGSLITSQPKNFGCRDGRNCFFSLLVFAAHLAASPSCTYRTQYKVAVRRIFLDNLFNPVVWVFPCLFHSLVVLLWGFFALFFLLTCFIFGAVLPCNICGTVTIAFYLEEWREKQKRGSCLFWFYFSSRVCLRAKSWKQDFRSDASLLPTGCVALDY